VVVAGHLLQLVLSKCKLFSKVMIMLTSADNKLLTVQRQEQPKVVVVDGLATLSIKLKASLLKRIIHIRIWMDIPHVTNSLAVQLASQEFAWRSMDMMHSLSRKQIILKKKFGLLAQFPFGCGLLLNWTTMRVAL